MLFAATAVLVGCQGGGEDFKASGSFEAEEVLVSSEANGIVLLQLAQEGQWLKEGMCAVEVDSIQLVLRRDQLLAQEAAVLAKRPDVKTQLAALEVQIDAAQREADRFEKLAAANGATKKQRDDARSQVMVLKKQYDALRSSLELQREGLTQESVPLVWQVKQLEDQIRRCKVINPLEGQVMVNYVEKGEFVSVGKPLYKIANLKKMILRVYITGDQLAQVQVNQQVRVMTDNGQGGMEESNGVIAWISDKAEFTPKTVQTKDERANLVYAVKVRVENTGKFKQGMYGQVNW